MSDGSSIEWTDATWNPVRGCSKVSEGCRNCYAMGVAARFSGPGQPYEGLARMTPRGPEWTGEVRVIEETLALPLKWKRPRRVFVNSMSDLFHPELEDDDIARVFNVMARAPQHTFQVLTKRPERMHGFVTAYTQDLHEGKPLPHVWLGTSVEDQAAADKRIPNLLRTPAAVRFLSCEPLLGPVDMTRWLMQEAGDGYGIGEEPRASEPRLHWVIVGGESGPSARPMHPEWARSLRNQCRGSDVAFFFKQWGEWTDARHGPPAREARFSIERGLCWLALDGHRCNGHDSREHRAEMMFRTGKKANGRWLDGEQHNAYPEVPA